MINFLKNKYMDLRVIRPPIVQCRIPVNHGPTGTVFLIKILFALILSNIVRVVCNRIGLTPTVLGAVNLLINVGIYS